jgi:hypothetical protein
MDAHKELGITHKWGPKHRLSSEMVDATVKIMNSAVDKEGMGKLTSPAYPLNKVADGFKKLGGPALFDVHSGLGQLSGLDGLMVPDQLKKLQDAAATLASQQHGLAEYFTSLHAIMLAIMEVYTIALRAEDPYRKSISTAVLKKLGLHTNLNKNDALGL